jgi:NTP pyrophosphatase (non-canonical NTP hydrolase)
MSNFKRPEITDSQIDNAVKEVVQQLNYCLEHNGPQAIVSGHEMSGLIKEETDELFSAVHDNNVEEIRSELKDVALTAIWALASMNATNVMGSWEIKDGK